MSGRRTGKWVCREKGIPTNKLIAACNSGRITAYSAENGQKILASSQCRKKFFFSDRLAFSLLSKKHDGYIAINKDDLNYFNIYLGNMWFYSDEYRYNGIENTIDLNKDAIPKHHLAIRGHHALHEFQYDNDYYLFFFKSKCIISKLSDIHRDRNYLYRPSEIIIVPQRAGKFTIRFLELGADNNSQVCNNVKFSINNLEYDNKTKLILDHDNNYISIVNDGLECLNCRVSPLRNQQKNRHFFSEAYKKCRMYFHQYKLNYYKQDDKEFINPLQLKKDFFIFDYKEYCQQSYLQENEESRSSFYQYIESLHFDINELKNIFIDDFEEEKMLEDPLGYTKLKCISLLEKYKGSDEANIIYAYLTSLSSNLQYAQLNDIFFPQEKDNDPNVKTSRYSRYIARFKSIAAENDFPYIPANQLRNLTSLKVLDEVKKSLREQLAAIRTKKENRPNRER